MKKPRSKPPIKVGARRRTDFYGTPVTVTITSVRQDASFGSGWCVGWRVPKCKHCGRAAHPDLDGEADAAWVGVKDEVLK